MSERAELKIVGLGGSLRAGSHSLSVLKIALESAARAGASVELLDLNAAGLPFFVPEQSLEAYPDAAKVARFLEIMGAADGYLWCAPTYHGTPSAAFKNALDFLELLPRRPHLYLSGKVAGLMALAGGTQAGPNALTALIYNARALRVLIAPGSLHISPARRLFDESGQLLDSKLLAQIDELGAEVVGLARLLRPDR